MALARVLGLVLLLSFFSNSAATSSSVSLEGEAKREDRLFFGRWLGSTIPFPFPCAEVTDALREDRREEPLDDYTKTKQQIR